VQLSRWDDFVFRVLLSTVPVVYSSELCVEATYDYWDVSRYLVQQFLFHAFRVAEMCFYRLVSSRRCKNIMPMTCIVVMKNTCVCIVTDAE